MRLCSIEGCDLRHCAKGLCTKHYRQIQIRGHTFVSKYELTDIERFKMKTKLNEENGCIDWIASFGNDGYGRFSTKKQGSIRAHRYAYEQEFGTIPNGLFVLHRCDRCACVNVEHLFLGTTQDNMTDMVLKGRSKALRGHEHHNSKLIEKDVKKIKILLSENVPRKEIQKIFNVGRSAIAKIATGITWKHIPFYNQEIEE
jgi:hypothetical protein